jgi:DNA polymerase-1
LIVSADYSQIELRLMAHMSGDKDLIAAFNSGKDIHTATAAKVFKVSEADVTREQRSRAKTANFGIIYGISAFGLSQRLGMSRSDSKQLIEEYFKNYPGVKEYMDNMILKARETGYVETIYGRRRFLPDINSRNAAVRSFNERNAINAPLQGSAADIIKVAMINIYKRLKSENLVSKMVLQVHDELVFDVVAQEVEIIKNIVKEEMERVITLHIPLIAECNAGKNWLEAH